MILKKVIIQNFRQFRDVVIDFAHNEDKNITMILGGNGTGKTNFLNAISWCLYGSEIHDFGDSTLDIYNKKVENLALIGDQIDVRVELEFLDDGKILAFNRVRGFYKGRDGLTREPSLDKFEVKTQEGHEIRVDNNPYYTIESKMPRYIENYFLFEETDLNYYFNSMCVKSLRDAIFSLSQINLIENLNSNIQKVKAKYIHDQKKISPKLGKVNEKINELDDNLRISKEKLKQAEEDIRGINDEIEKIDSELINRDSTAIYNSFRRNKELEMRITQINNKVSDLEDKLEKHILLKYPYVMSYNSILQFVDLMDFSFDRGYVSNDVKFFIKNLLKEGKCVCGTDLSVDIEHRRMLEDFLENTGDTPDYAENIPKILEHIKNVIIKDIKNFKSLSIDYHREILTLNKEREAFIDEKRDIEAMLKANPVEEVNKLINLRKDLITVKHNLESKKSNLKDSIEKDYRLLGEQRKLLSHQDELYKEIETYQKKIDLCDGVNIATDSLQNSLKQDIRKKIQDLTKDYLLHSHWREGEGSDLILDDEFNILIKNNYGNIEKPTDLSDGEKTILIICFICALHKLSGFELPIVLDVSFSNLDFESRNNLINSLPELIGHNQLILLSNQDYYRNISNHIVKEYNISKKNSTEGIESEVILNG